MNLEGNTIDALFPIELYVGGGNLEDVPAS